MPISSGLRTCLFHDPTGAYRPSLVVLERHSNDGENVHSEMRRRSLSLDGILGRRRGKRCRVMFATDSTPSATADGARLRVVPRRRDVAERRIEAGGTSDLDIVYVRY